jgi:hypothetical protein
MSLLPPEVHAAVNQLLVGLQASDNVVRTQAEETLNTEWIGPRPEILLMALAEQIIGAEAIGVCAISCSLLSSYVASSQTVV